MWQEFADVLPRIWTARNCASAGYPRLSSAPVRILVGSFWSVLAAGDMNPEGKGRADHLAKAKPKTGVAVRSGMENWVTVADGLRSIWHKREKQPVDAFGTRSRGRMPRA